MPDRDPANLDITWLKDDSHLNADDLPDPDVLVDDTLGDFGAALGEFEALAEELEAASVSGTGEG